MDDNFPPVAELVPHQGQALLVDTILAATADSICVAADITAAHPYFVHGHGVPAWVGIEMMAQAIAALAGIQAHRNCGTRGSGMLLGTRRYHAYTAYFAEHARLEISARREYSDVSGIAACACTIQCGGAVLAEATLIVMKTSAELPA